MVAVFFLYHNILKTQYLCGFAAYGRITFLLFFLLNNALEWGRMFIKVVESGLKCIEVVRSGRFLG